jgi:hypothetical protein
MEILLVCTSAPSAASVAPASIRCTSTRNPGRYRAFGKGDGPLLPTRKRHIAKPIANPAILTDSSRCESPLL